MIKFKKIISAMLAVTTVASMATVAFAGEDSKNITVDVATGLYTYDDESDSVHHVDGDVEPGEDIYIGVVANDIDGTVTAGDFGNYRLKASWDYGNHAVSKPEFTTIKVGSDRIAVIKIDGKYTTSTKAVDVVGNITVTAKGSAIVNGGEEVVVPVDFTYAWGKTEGDGYVDSSAPVVFFDGLEEVTLEFDGGVEFTVDAKNQSDLFLKMNTKIDSAMVDKYNDFNLDFINFEGSNKTFNKTGTVTIPYAVDKGVPHIYLNNGGTLTEIKNCYDKDEEAFIFKTKTLGNWVISDKALDVKEDTSKPETSKPSSSKPATGKPNPDTGR